MYPSSGEVVAYVAAALVNAYSTNQRRHLRCRRFARNLARTFAWTFARHYARPLFFWTQVAANSGSNEYTWHCRWAVRPVCMASHCGPSAPLHSPMARIRACRKTSFSNTPMRTSGAYLLVCCWAKIGRLRGLGWYAVWRQDRVWTWCRIGKPVDSPSSRNKGRLSSIQLCVVWKGQRGMKKKRYRYNAGMESTWPEAPSTPTHFSFILARHVAAGRIKCSDISGSYRAILAVFESLVAWDLRVCVCWFGNNIMVS